MLLPVLLFMAVLLIDGGRRYIRFAELKHLSASAANSGMIELSELLTEQATANFLAFCSEVPPPPFCETQNIYAFLTPDEVDQIVQSPNTRSKILTNILNYATSFDPQTRDPIRDEEINMTFPINYYYGAPVVTLKVDLTDTETRLFNTFLTQRSQNPITFQATAHSSLPLN